MRLRVDFSRTDSQPGGELMHTLFCDEFVQLTYESLRFGPEGDFVAGYAHGEWRLTPSYSKFGAEGEQDEWYTDVTVSAADTSPLRVYAIAFRHKTPGEGVGGVEWDVQPGAARDRVRPALEDPDYETAEREFYIVGVTVESIPKHRDEITEAVDAHFWADFGGQYTEPVQLEV